MRLLRSAALVLAVAAGLSAARFGIGDIGKIVRLTGPEIAPDGKSIAIVVSRTNYEENRYDPELLLIDIATHGQRVLTHDRRGVSQARWSPDGSRLAFLATADGKAQIFVLPMSGGDAVQITRSPVGVQQYAWRPGGRNEIAFVASDEAPKLRERNATIAPSRYRTTISCCRKPRVRPTSG